MHCTKPLSAAIAGVLLMLAGCDKTVESGNYRLNISPSLGQVQNADVYVYSAVNSELLGKGKTRATGYLGLFPKRTDDAVFISLQGDGSTVYFDELLGLSSLGIVSFPTGYRMRAIVPNVSGNYGLTALTEIAYNIAVSENLFPLTVKEVNIINSRVTQAFAPELSSILVQPTIIGSETDDGSLADDTPANRYAMRLAALAMLPKLCASYRDGELSTFLTEPAKAGLCRASEHPAVDMMAAMTSDILDGKIDGIDKNNLGFSPPYDYILRLAEKRANDRNPADAAERSQFYYQELAIAWPEVWSQVLVEVADKYATDALKLAVPDFPPVSTTIDLANINDGSNYTGCKDVVDGDPSVLPPGIADQSINMIFENVDFEAPYNSGEVVRFSFCANGQLRLTNDYIVVANDFEQSPPASEELTYTWKQLSNGLTYELEVVGSSVFEVNVYGSNGTYYYGRFRPL